jgi:hypothetical protein
MGGVKEISSKCYMFFNHEKLVFQVFESVWKKVLQFIESLRCVEERSLSC